MEETLSKTEVVAIARETGKAILSGIPTAAEQEANSYLMLVAVVVVICAVTVLAWLVLRHLKGMDASEDQRTEAVSNMGDKCHETAMAMLKQLSEHSSKSDERTTEAIARCSSAVERGTIALEQNGRLLERCLSRLDVQNGGMGS
jgi:hypothetical protein